MLNKNIQIDLHIHSKASEYKENGLASIENCTKDNLDVLFSKLSENNINMFSITDHNRFDKELYEAIDNLIEKKSYPTVLSVLAGVEFDVQLEDGKPGCHIIVIFNTKSITDYEKINEVIESDKLTKISDEYSIDRFLTILRKIGFDTILIAHQKSAFDNRGNHKSLGDATEHPEKYLCYIDALEYNKSRIEGIVKDSLREYESQPGLITGSDCHDWTNYPKHDKESKCEEYSTRIRSLPTFKGILMALSSPDTRFNRSNEKEDKRVINNIRVDGHIIEFSSGINAIIGENGSGKSSILKLLNNDKDKYLSGLAKHSKIECNENFSEKTKYLEQSKLVQLSNNDDLFKGEAYYKSIDLASFNRVWTEFDKKIQDYFQQHIDVNILEKDISKKKLTLRSYSGTYFYINFIIGTNFTEGDNPYLKHVTELDEIIRRLIVEIEDKGIYSVEQLDILSNVSLKVYSVREELNKNSVRIEMDKKVHNIISATINDYKTNYDARQSTASREKASYTESLHDFANAITELCKKQSRLPHYPEYPEPMKLAQINNINGFIFKNQSEYSDTNLSLEYLKSIFNKDYQTDKALQSIDSFTDLIKAISSADKSNYKEKWVGNFGKFLGGVKKETKFMYSANENRSLSEGSTLGELSLAYYQFVTYNSNDFDLLVIDQPEDNISNTNISDHLIKFMNRLRDKVQVIYVTHNPLLVVNLDVDNVICLNKNNNQIYAQSGCLEDSDILSHVSDNMDGGKEMIKKRLKIYG